MEPYSSAFLHFMNKIVMKIVSVNTVKAKSIKKNSIHISFEMFVKLLTDVNGLYILWVSAEMAYNFYNNSAGCPMQIDFNLKHCLGSVYGFQWRHFGASIKTCTQTTGVKGSI